MTNEELLEEIEKKTILEVADLIKSMKERWGVEAAFAAAPMAGAPAAGGGGAAAAAPDEEQFEFNVVLKEFGPKKIEVIKVVRELTALGLKEAKDLVEAAPKPVKEAVGKDEANAAAAKLREAGAVVDVV
jgi:large subunit ribosomal protein L7/L12